MPQKAWTAKRERQYAHIKDSLLEGGKSEPLAEEIAARVVNNAKQGALRAYCAPDQFHVTALPADDAVYRWQIRLVAHHFCAYCGCATFSDSPAFEPDGKWDGSTRRIGVNAGLFDDFDAALAAITVIDGKHLW